ncbi:MAG TPA: hypothetical protein VHV75_12245 [Solirubrobacteraceae bacterium]|nr:hypothetical protein [Solirubrobacteraceae bacterium]
MIIDLAERIRVLEQALAIRDLTIESQARHIDAQDTELRRMGRILRDLRGERGQ